MSTTFFLLNVNVFLAIKLMWGGLEAKGEKSEGEPKKSNVNSNEEKKDQLSSTCYIKSQKEIGNQ